MNIRAIVCSALAALAISTASGPAAADDGFGRSQAPALLEGTWQVRITPYFCATGVPLPPAAAFDSLFSFASRGTMTETTSNPRSRHVTCNPTWLDDLLRKVSCPFQAPSTEDLSSSLDHAITRLIFVPSHPSYSDAVIDMPFGPCHRPVQPRQQCLTR